MHKIPLIEPVKDVREFSNVDEFDKFYETHTDMFEEFTTCKLNKMFKIPGYRITKLQGKVHLKNIPDSKITANDKIDELTKRMSDYESKTNSIIDSMNSIIELVNKLSKQVKQMEKEKPKTGGITSQTQQPFVIRGPDTNTQTQQRKVVGPPRTLPVGKQSPKVEIEPEPEVIQEEPPPIPQSVEMSRAQPIPTQQSQQPAVQGYFPPRDTPIARPPPPIPKQMSEKDRNNMEIPVTPQSRYAMAANAGWV